MADWYIQVYDGHDKLVHKFLVRNTTERNALKKIWAKFPQEKYEAWSWVAVIARSKKNQKNRVVE